MTDHEILAIAEQVFPASNSPAWPEVIAFARALIAASPAIALHAALMELYKQVKDANEETDLNPVFGYEVDAITRLLDGDLFTPSASPAALTDEQIFAAQEQAGLPNHPHGGSQEVLHFARLIERCVIAASPADQVEPYPIQYVLTDADHMAATFDALESALNERDAAVLEREESDGDDSPERLESAAESIADLTHSMRRAIHEYRKRAERYRASMSASKEGA